MTGFSPRRRHSDRSHFISQNPCGSSAFQDEEQSFPPAPLSGKAAHGKQQEGPLADTAAAGDSGLWSPLAHHYHIHNVHTGFVLLFHCSCLHTDFLQSLLVITTPQVTETNPSYQAEQPLLTSSRSRRQSWTFWQQRIDGKESTRHCFCPVNLETDPQPPSFLEFSNSLFNSIGVRDQRCLSRIGFGICGFVVCFFQWGFVWLLLFWGWWCSVCCLFVSCLFAFPTYLLAELIHLPGISRFFVFFFERYFMPYS